MMPAKSNPVSRTGILLAAMAGLAIPLFAQTKPAGLSAAGVYSVPALPTFPPVADDPIERPEFRTKAHPILKSVTSATAMMVILSDDGGEIGLTSDVIAAVGADSRKGSSGTATFISKQGQVGPQMKTSFDEAVRAVKLRYPQWEPGTIEFSFGEKYTAHDGGSAGTCFAVMLLSQLEGFDIDPKCAITGDITVDWKVKKIGGTGAKLRGATADKCLYAGVPETNSSEVADMFLLNGFESVRDIQIFSLDTLQDAVALLRKDRAPQLVEAMKEFAALQPQMKSKGSLTQPMIQKGLEQILMLAPNHESAKWLLAIGKGTAPRQLTVSSALEILHSTMAPYFSIFAAGRDISRQNVPQALTAASRKELTLLRPIAPKELGQIVVDCVSIMETTELVASKQTPVKILADRLQTFKTHLQALDLDKDLREKLMRE